MAWVIFYDLIWLIERFLIQEENDNEEFNIMNPRSAARSFFVNIMLWLSIAICLRLWNMEPYFKFIFFLV